MATIKKIIAPALPAGRRRLIMAGAAALALLTGACAESPGIAEIEASGEANTVSQEQHAQSPDSLLRLADAALAVGDRTSAVGLYNRAAKAAPSDPKLQVRLGFRLHELGAQLEAEAAFRRAISADLGNADALRGLGITLISRDMPHHAIEYLEEAIAARPDSRAYNAMGVALDMVGERGTAQEAYRAGLAADPENLSLLNNLGLSLTLSGRHADAIAILGRVADDPNATPRHRQNLALAYGLAGSPEKAAEVANTDLDMRSVRNNLGYYAWLRRQPSEITEQALGANIDTTAAIQLAEAIPATDSAPPPLAEGAAPMFDGALLDEGPLVLTPGSQTGSLYYGSGEAGAVTESAPPAPRQPSTYSEPPDSQGTQNNIIWELQSIETDDPAAKDADGKGAGGKDTEKNGETKSESKENTRFDGRSDGSSGVDGSELSETAANSSEIATALTDSSLPVDEFAGLAFATPRDATSTVSRVGSLAATEAAPLPTQIADLNAGEGAQDVPHDYGMLSTRYVGDLPADDVAIEPPSSQDSIAARESVEDFDTIIATLPTQAGSTASRPAAPPETMDVGDREENVAATPPDSLIDETETGKTGTSEMAASGPQPDLLADKKGAEASPPSAARSLDRPGGSAAVAVQERPPLAGNIQNIDSSPILNDGATVVAGRTQLLEPAAETTIVTNRGIANPPAKSGSNGMDAARAGGPTGVGPPAARAPENAVDQESDISVADALTPLESAENNNFKTESDGNTRADTPPEAVLALASPPRHSTPSPKAENFQSPDTRQRGNQTAAMPQAEALSADSPQGSRADGQEDATGLLRSGMSLGLGRPLSAIEARHDKPRHMASAEPAAGGARRTLVGSLTPPDRDTAALATAAVSLGRTAKTGISTPIYGLAALISAVLLSFLWSRRRRLGGSDSDARADTD